jgi:hypothetical protein
LKIIFYNYQLPGKETKQDSRTKEERAKRIKKEGLD